jgi:hypothetical protein
MTCLSIYECQERLLPQYTFDDIIIYASLFLVKCGWRVLGQSIELFTIRSPPAEFMFHFTTEMSRLWKAVIVECLAIFLKICADLQESMFESDFGHVIVS